MVNFLQLGLFKEIILPFIFFFTLLFAILEKSKILGSSSKQINAIVAFASAAVLIGFSTQVTWMNRLLVFMAIALVVIFVFLLMYGFIFGATEGDMLKGNDKLKKFLAALAFVAVAIAVLVITDYWDSLIDFFTGETGGNIILVLVIIGAVVAVFYGSGSSGSAKPAKT